MKIDDFLSLSVTATLDGKLIWSEALSGQGSDRAAVALAKKNAVDSGEITQLQADAAKWVVN